MQRKKPYQTTETDLKVLAAMKSVNERIEWIRNKASEVNNGHYTVSKVANDIEVGPSVLTKLESGFTKNPNLDLLQKLSNYFNVPIIAFFDEYYVSPYPFTIFGLNHSGLDVGPLFREAYQIDLSCTISSLNSEYTEALQECFQITPLEYEEVKEEFEYFLYKLRERKQRWASMLMAMDKLSGGMHNE
jgi:transcriptional regulator with XRE-family HTH domain